MPDHNAIQLSTTQPPSSAIQQADEMSLSLLFSLGRYYLDAPISPNIWKINTPTTQLEAPNFLLLEQVGNPVGSATQQPLTALQTALSACHAPGQYSLIFIVTSDGIQNRIYFGVRGHSLYCASKAALDGLMRALAVELAPETRVNSILPGALDTSMSASALSDPQVAASLKANYPLGIGKPEDIANAVQFLMSDEARWLTGQEIVIDGGRTVNFSLK
jgi:NAD(P)-dependent dehydrogenase (short-subunit alcohol dehydrogenase family)